MVSNDVLILLGSVLAGLSVTLFALSVTPVWDVLARWQIADLSDRMRMLNMNEERLQYYLRIWGGALVVVGGGLALLRVWPIAVAAVGLVYFAPRVLLDLAIQRRTHLLRDQMVSACLVVSNSCRAGLALEQALERASQETPTPLCEEFRRFVVEYQRGRPLVETLSDARERLNIDGFTLFTSALLVNLERGGRVTDDLDRIGRSLEENQRLERKMEADTAAGRKVVFWLTLFPFVFFLVYLMTFRDAAQLLLTDAIGQVVVVAILLIVVASSRWAKKITTLDV